MEKHISHSNAERLYRHLMKPNAFAISNVQRKIDRVGQLIDLAGAFTRGDGLDRALAVSDDLLKQVLTSAQRGLLSYFRANAWSHRRSLAGDDLAKWELPELERETPGLEFARSGGAARVLCFRHAVHLHASDGPPRDQ